MVIRPAFSSGPTTAASCLQLMASVSAGDFEKSAVDMGLQFGSADAMLALIGVMALACCDVRRQEGLVACGANEASEVGICRAMLCLKHDITFLWLITTPSCQQRLCNPDGCLAYHDDPSQEANHPQVSLYLAYQRHQPILLRRPSLKVLNPCWPDGVLHSLDTASILTANRPEEFARHLHPFFILCEAPHDVELDLGCVEYWEQLISKSPACTCDSRLMCEAQSAFAPSKRQSELKVVGILGFDCV